MTFVFSPYAKLPLQVQTQIQEQMWNYKGSNLALLETSHRSPVFAKVNDDTILAIKLYLSVPNNYKILLMQGGEQLTQGSLPFNLLAGRNKCTYLITGPRSQFAQSQAALHPDVTVVSHTLQSTSTPTKVSRLVKQRDLLTPLSASKIIKRGNTSDSLTSKKEKMWFWIAPPFWD